MHQNKTKEYQKCYYERKKKAIQRVKSKKEGKISINQRRSSLMTLFIDKKEIVKKLMPKEKLEENEK